MSTECPRWYRSQFEGGIRGAISVILEFCCFCCWEAFPSYTGASRDLGLVSYVIVAVSASFVFFFLSSSKFYYDVFNFLSLGVSVAIWILVGAGLSTPALLAGELNLFSLSKRRLKKETVIQVFKMHKGYDNFNISKYFSISHSNVTRSNGCKNLGKRFQSLESKHLFFSRVVNVWNKLPFDVINCSSIDSFKNIVDIFMKANHNSTNVWPKYLFLYIIE